MPAKAEAEARPAEAAPTDEGPAKAETKAGSAEVKQAAGKGLGRGEDG